METHTNISIALLHAAMHNKNGEIVTASLTMIDVHDLARSARTYGVNKVYVAHPAETLRRLSLKLKSHWEVGFGSTYNPNRKEALEIIEIVTSLDDAIDMIEKDYGKKPKLIATSARDGDGRVNFSEMRAILSQDFSQPFMLLLGTGWGMSEALLERADYFLEPVQTKTGYNHLSVRSACAIMLDRLLSI